MKNNIHFILIISLFISCYQEKKQELIEISGQAQGTTYTIKYIDSANRNFKNQVDSLLLSIDFSLSAWNQQSYINAWNNNQTQDFDFHFNEVLKKSIFISEITSGHFDITIAPLTEAYGFGFKKMDNVTEVMINEYLQHVGYQQLLSENKIWLKTDSLLKVDVNAIAQGYSVDVIGHYFKKNGITNFMIELGGEVLCLGKKPDGNDWKIGIENPIENKQDRSLNALVAINNTAMATSGNYRKTFEKDGIKYAHTISPFTGKPVFNEVLSATVFAPTCAEADAFATSFMVMGLEKTKEFLIAHPELKLAAYLIYRNENQEMATFTSPGLIIEKLEQ
jgi:thiamine biosynthesis lipoprotein